MSLDFLLVGIVGIFGDYEGRCIGEVGRVREWDGLRFGYARDTFGQDVFCGELEVDGLSFEGFDGRFGKELFFD